MFKQCPGSMGVRQPSAEEIVCPGCSALVEIWSDEAKALCPSCLKDVWRAEPVRCCLDWCSFARECLGGQRYEEYKKGKFLMLKERLILEMRNVFGEDSRRITHALAVLSYAEDLLRRVKADWHIVVPSAILHDIGIKAAEAKYSSTAGVYQEKESEIIARQILQRTGFNAADTMEICSIISNHHSPGRIQTVNFRILYDADCLVNLKELLPGCGREKMRRIIADTFLTEEAKEMAARVYAQYM